MDETDVDKNRSTSLLARLVICPDDAGDDEEGGEEVAAGEGGFDVEGMHHGSAALTEVMVFVGFEQAEFRGAVPDCAFTRLGLHGQPKRGDGSNNTKISEGG